MIFRSRKREEATTAVKDPGDRENLGATADDGVDSAEELSAEELFRRIDALSQDNRAARDPQMERSIRALRHRAGMVLTRRPATDLEYPAPDFDRLPDGSHLPEISPEELTPGLLRAAILRSGCLLIRGLVEPEEAGRLVEGIDRAFEAREQRGSTGSPDKAYYDVMKSDPRLNLGGQRTFVSEDAGGLWCADSPRVLFDMLEAFDRSGLRRLAGDYLGERPAISANKCTLRRVRPETGKGLSLWHQDGAFMGRVRALNVWLSLSHCGDLAPGLDIVPRRIDHVLPTGTEGSVFDWSISRSVVEEAAGEVAIARPIFEPGDVLLFDELCVHATAAEPGMPDTRYAIESWFFGTAGFPDDYAPLAV